MNSDKLPFSDELLEALKERELWVGPGQDKHGGYYFRESRRGRIVWKMRYLSDHLVPPDHSTGEPGIFSKEKKWKLYKREDNRDKLTGVSGWDESIQYILDHTRVSGQTYLF
jgi:hypothetical protein